MMVSRTVAVCVCCVIIGAFRSVQAAYLRPIQLDGISEEASQVGRPGLALIALCWDGQNVITECHRRSLVIKQTLYRLLHSLETQSGQRAQKVFEDTRDNGHFRKPAKRTSDRPSGFYSNW